MNQPLEEIPLHPQPLSPADDPRYAENAPPIIKIRDGIELHGAPSAPQAPVIEIPDGAAAPPGYVIVPTANRKERRAMAKKMWRSYKQSSKGRRPPKSLRRTYQ
jgi:hypothetical protein